MTVVNLASFVLVEEQHVRKVFNEDQGHHLPADICLCIENPPTRWEVLPCRGESLEILPDIDNDILVQVCLLNLA